MSGVNHRVTGVGGQHEPNKQEKLCGSGIEQPTRRAACCRWHHTMIEKQES